MHIDTRKKIVVTGGAGFIGSFLCKALVSKGYSVVSLDGRPSAVEGVDSVVAYTTDKNLDAHKELAGAFAWINLGGTTIAGRWSKKKKQSIYDSRVKGTLTIRDYFEKTSFPSKFISASAVGVYGDSGDEILDEYSSLKSENTSLSYLARVAADWEKASEEVSRGGTKVTVVRQGHVLGKAGLVSFMLPFYKCGLGGPLGDGKQWLSWIYISDLVTMYVQLLEKDLPEGAQTVNAVAKEPVRQKDFSALLAQIIKRPHVFFIPVFALRLVYRGFGKEIVMSQRVHSSLPFNDEFEYNDLTKALKESV